MTKQQFGSPLFHFIIALVLTPFLFIILFLSAISLTLSLLPGHDGYRQVKVSKKGVEIARIWPNRLYMYLREFRGVVTKSVGAVDIITYTGDYIFLKKKA